jgi:putative DNA primase/helicase
LLAVNNLPQFPDRSRAVEARLRITYFNQSFLGKEDWGMKDRLKEAAGEGKLINWALQGLADLRKSGRFTTPKSSLKVLESFRNLSTPVIPFIAECCNRCPDTVQNEADQLSGNWWVSKDELYGCWKGWCDDNGRMPGSKENFIQNLASIYPMFKFSRRLIGTQRVQVVIGLRVQTWVAATYLRRQK